MIDRRSVRHRWNHDVTHYLQASLNGTGIATTSPPTHITWLQKISKRRSLSRPRPPAPVHGGIYFGILLRWCRGKRSKRLRLHLHLLPISVIPPSPRSLPEWRRPSYERRTREQGSPMERSCVAAAPCCRPDSRDTCTCGVLPPAPCNHNFRKKAHSSTFPPV